MPSTNINIDFSIYQKRRKSLIDMIDDGIVILPTAPIYYRNRDVEFAFRPDSDFYYLTHFPEPEAIIVLIKKTNEFILFCRENDPTKELWNGTRAGLKNACKIYGADKAHSFNEIHKILPKLMQNQSKVYCNLGRYPVFDKQLIDYLNDMRGQNSRDINIPTEFVDIGHILHELRLYKRADERKLMKKVAKVTSNAHIETMKACKPDMYEYELQAIMEYHFVKHGCRWPAYQSIVAGGKNACILHYTNNQDKLKGGDLVLIDAGAEYDCYAADITRTFPVSGKFTLAQKTVYNIVLDAQLAAIDAVKPGNHWNDPHIAATRVITQGLIDIGIIDSSLDEALDKQLYKDYFMHKTGHWLGMDVHDVGDYKVEEQWRLLEPGMMLTIEPGIYIRPNANIDRKWHNIGIRIEDDVMVTKSGHEVITNVPKTVKEIEDLMSS